MKSIKLFSILLFFSLYFSSCYIVHCDGFPPELEGWTPYKVGDVLKFQSDSDLIVFEIDSTYITKPYSFEGQIEKVCSADYEFSSDKNKLPLLTGNTGIADCSFVSVFYFLTFEKSKQNLINFDYFLNKPIMNYGSCTFDTVSYQLKNSIVKDVIVIEKIKSPYNPDVNKIFVHNGKGLVGFIKNGREYKLVE